MSILGILGIYYDLPYNNNAKELEALLTQKAEQSLRDHSIRWADVTMQGQKAILSGTAPNEDSIAKAKSVIRAADWPGGHMLGGITSVDMNAVRLAGLKQPDLPVAAPFTWNATLHKDRTLTLSGYVPSDDIRAEILQEAKQIYPAGVIDEMQLARGMTDENWTRTVLRHLDALQIVQEGGIAASDFDFTIFGATTDAKDRLFITDRISHLPAPYTNNLDLTFDQPIAPPAQSPATAVPADEDTTRPAPLPPTQEPSQAIDPVNKQCQDKLSALSTKNEIYFDSGSALLDPASRPALLELVAITKQCADYTIEIGGHTDATGNAAANMKLSQDRADIIVRFLASKGVPTQNISATGYGATHPVASNDTAQGRAQNRRIEITIQNEK
ncbi:MAG: OmpA family protein [bacterium]